MRRQEYHRHPRGNECRPNLTVIKSLLANFKTTAAGLLMVIGSVIHLVFTYKTADEQTWTVAVTAMVAGLGLMFAGDASTSQQEIAKVDTKVQENADAIVTGDTTMLTQRAAGVVSDVIPPTVKP
jgi:hypothetical protein